MRPLHTLALALFAPALALLACGEHDPAAPVVPTADLAFVAMAPSYVSTISVEVTGPGISPPLVINLTVAGGTATGQLRLPTGSDRRLVARAYDVLGISTHRGDTTVTVYEGSNPRLTMVLQPLVGNQPVTVTIGTTVVDVLGPDTTILLSDTLQLAAIAANGRGQAARLQDIAWASANPGILSVSPTGLVTATALGTAAAVATYEGAAAGRRITVAAPSGYLYFQSSSGEVRRVRPDGSGLETIRVPRAGWSGAYHAVSPDGQSVVFTAESTLSPIARRAQVVVFRVDGTVERVVFDSTGTGGQSLFGSAWSPDGQRLVFSWRCPTCAVALLYLINADGTGLTQLTSGDSLGNQWFPTWSPDGQRIAFNCFADLTSRDICVVGGDGTGLVRVTTDPAREAHPAWLSDSRLVFLWNKTGNGDLYAVNLDGTGLTQLTDNPDSESWPRPSPNRRLVVFWAPVSGVMSLHVLDVRGRGRYRVAVGEVHSTSWPSWGP